MQHDLVTKPFGHVDGWVYPPTGPGLGIEVIEDVVDGYRSEKVLERRERRIRKPPSRSQEGASLIIETWEENMKAYLKVARRIGRIGARGRRGCRAGGRRARSQIPTTGEKVAGAPFEVEARLGRLSSSPNASPTRSRRASKINYVFSYQASGIPLFSPQYAAGFAIGCKTGNAIYPMDCACDRPGADRPEPAGLADRGQTRRRRDRLHLASSRRRPTRPRPSSTN